MFPERKEIEEVLYEEPTDAPIIGKAFERARDKVNFQEERLVVVFLKEKIVQFQRRMS